jgi:hypothetical protein
MINRQKSNSKSRQDRPRVKRFLDEKFGAGFLRNLALDSFGPCADEAELIPVRVETGRRRTTR